MTVPAQLLFVGGVNWGLMGFFGFDQVASIFGSMSLVSRFTPGRFSSAAQFKGIPLVGSPNENHLKKTIHRGEAMDYYWRLSYSDSNILV